MIKTKFFIKKIFLLTILVSFLSATTISCSQKGYRKSHVKVRHKKPPKKGKMPCPLKDC